MGGKNTIVSLFFTLATWLLFLGDGMFLSAALPQILKKPWFYLSLGFGIAFGLFTYSYWLIDMLPPMSKRAIVGVGIISIVAAFGWFFVLEKWLFSLIINMRVSIRWKFVFWSIVGGTFIMLMGSKAWEKPTRNLVFLLPSQNIEFSVPSEQDTSSSVGISFIKTSVGDVLFDATDYRGWKKTGNTLILQDWANNSLKWSGKTGDKVEVVFLSNSQDVRVNVSVNGVEQEVVITPGQDGKFIYRHKFYVPGFASRNMVVFLALFNFTLMASIILGFIWQNKESLIQEFSESLTYHPNKGMAWGFESGIIVCIILAALLLRIFRLDALPPYIDEYPHINVAKDIVLGASFSSVYQRSFWIVTMPVALAFQVFGAKLWVARFVGVLFNALAVVPLYKIMRKINQPIAIICGILFATNPWIIATSRSVREYAYYPFYFCWILYGLILVIERFPARFSLRTDAVKLLKMQLLVPSLLLLLPLYYGVFIDRQSTFNLIFGAYAIFCMVIFMKIDFKDKSTLWLLIAIGVFIVIGVNAGLIYSKHHAVDIPSWKALFNPVLEWSNKKTGIYLPTNISPLRLFFTNPVQQWYYNRALLFVALVVACALVISVMFYRVNFIPLFVLILYIQQLAFFVFFFKRYFRARYLSSVQIWYVMLLAVGIYGFWLILRKLLNNRGALLVSVVVIAATCNVEQILLPSLNTEAMPMPITGEYHGNTSKANNFLQDKVMQGDVLISTYYASYAYFIGAPVFSKTYNYIYYEQTMDDINSVVQQNKSGWIVMDNTTGLYFSKIPKKDFNVDDKKVEYLGAYGDQLIWNWRASE